MLPSCTLLSQASIILTLHLLPHSHWLHHRNMVQQESFKTLWPVVRLAEPCPRSSCSCCSAKDLADACELHQHAEFLCSWCWSLRSSVACCIYVFLLHCRGPQLPSWPPSGSSADLPQLPAMEGLPSRPHSPVRQDHQHHGQPDRAAAGQQHLPQLLVEQHCHLVVLAAAQH